MAGAVLRRVVIDERQPGGFTSPGLEVAPFDDEGADQGPADFDFVDLPTAMEVLQLIDDGWPMPAIAGALGLTESEISRIAEWDLWIDPTEIDTDCSFPGATKSGDPERQINAALVEAGLETARTDAQKFRDPASADDAAKWLAEHDPRVRALGVEVEVELALARSGLTMDVARAAFRKTGGRPNREIRDLRGSICRALEPMWIDDWRRGLMADALGVDRKTLRRLMAKPPHAVY